MGGMYPDSLCETLLAAVAARCAGVDELVLDTEPRVDGLGPSR